MKKKDLIVYAGAAVLLAFSTQQVKADEQVAADQTSENTSAVVLKTTTVSETQNIATDGVKTDQAVQTEKSVVTETAPVTPTVGNNPSFDKGTSDKVVSENPAPAVGASRAPYGARARVVEARNESVPQQDSPVSADLNIKKSESEEGTFTITAKNLQGFDGYKEVKIPFWSHANGMKDIVWYTPTRQADGSYTVTAKASAHEHADGKYEAQVFYVDAQGQNKFVKKAFIDYTAPKPSADLTITKSEKEGTFTITAKNLQGFDGYKEVKIPFWSHANGMKDIVWYTPTRQADGSYTVTAKANDHENADGKYEAQVFYVDAQGQNKFVKKAFVDYTAPKPSADLTITKSEKEGTFTITAKNLQGFDGYKEVKIPFWSHANGMKDIVWYTPTRQADGSYTVTAKASDHENADGKYEAQVFYVDAKGQNKFVKKAFIDFKNQSRPTGNLIIQNNNKDTGTFDVIIKDVYSPKGVRTVQVPTWSDKDGQDDIRWYEATRQSNGDYKVSIKASDHKNSTGKYHIHLYYIQNDGSRVGVGTTTTEVEFRNAKTKTQTGIKNVNSGAGTYMVTVDQAPQGRRIKNIRVAVWSKAHQENLFWYAHRSASFYSQSPVSTGKLHHSRLCRLCRWWC